MDASESKMDGRKGKRFGPEFHTEESKRRVGDAKRQWWASRTPEQLKAIKEAIGRSSKGRIKGGDKHPSWKGGRSVSARDGYVTIVVPHGTPGAKKANGADTNTLPVMLEHRYVMQQHLGRPLRRDENVHHRNGKKDDNRIENLMLVPHMEHFEKFICPHCNKEFYHQ